METSPQGHSRIKEDRHLPPLITSLSDWEPNKFRKQKAGGLRERSDENNLNTISIFKET